MSKSLIVFPVLFFLLFSSVSASQNQNKNKNKNQARVKICETRQGQVKNRFEKILNISTNQIANFDQKVQRVKNYYSQKLVPAGKTVPNYGVLVADVEAKKAAVQVSVSKARAESDSFTCNNEPLKAVQDFRKYTQETNTALKNYRTAVKNLIVAVRSQSAID